MRRAALWLVLMIALPGAALAQTDEIQVYEASIADVGQWDVELHSN